MPMATPEERTRAYKLSFVPVQRHLDGARFDEAVAELERLAAACPDCPEAHNDLAVLYHAAGRLTEADRESRRALELDPFNADIRENRNAIISAIAGNGTGTGAGPIAAPAPSASIAPAAAPAANGSLVYRDVLRTAEALLAAGDLDGAVAEIERFVDRQPATAEAWNDLGVLHRDGGRLRAARAALVVATTVEPSNRTAAYNLIRVLLEMGEHTEALRTLEPLLTRDPRDVEALTLAGDISLGLGQGSDASVFYRSALALDPSDAGLAVKLATAAMTSPPPARAPVPAPASAPPSAPTSFATLPGAFSLSAFMPAPVTFTPAPAPAPAPSPSSLSSSSSSSPPGSSDAVRALEYDPRVRLVTPDESYDTVTCRIPLDRLPNPIAALGEMARLLKPGGKLWIDLGGPLEVIKHAAPGGPAAGRVTEILPVLRAR